MTNKEWLLERLQWEDWERFLAYTVGYARKQIKRRRGPVGMVLPGGHDANSVASEVVARVLSGETRLAIGWTVERFKAELKRQVNRELRRLLSRREASTTVSEWAVLPRDEQGEASSIFQELERLDGLEEASGDRMTTDRDDSAIALERQVAGDALACGVLRCLSAGVVKRREIAAALGVDVGAVTAARKRLKRMARRVGWPNGVE